MINIVLFEPEIPENTGNIARTCVAFGMKLHLIRPYGFFLNNRKMVRSGVDYWQKLELFEHDSYDDFLKLLNTNDKIFYVTRYGKNIPSNIDMKCKNNENIFIVFGKESTGINKDILVANEKNTIRIPSSKNVRSMNLSNCVAILAYEVTRQNNFNDLEFCEPHNPLFEIKK